MTTPRETSRFERKRGYLKKNAEWLSKVAIIYYRSAEIFWKEHRLLKPRWNPERLGSLAARPGGAAWGQVLGTAWGRHIRAYPEGSQIPIRPPPALILFHLQLIGWTQRRCASRRCCLLGVRLEQLCQAGPVELLPAPCRTGLCKLRHPCPELIISLYWVL